MAAEQREQPSGFQLNFQEQWDRVNSQHRETEERVVGLQTGLNTMQQMFEERLTLAENRLGELQSGQLELVSKQTTNMAELQDMVANFQRVRVDSLLLGQGSLLLLPRRMRLEKRVLWATTTIVKCEEPGVSLEEGSSTTSRGAGGATGERRTLEETSWGAGGAAGMRTLKGGTSTTSGNCWGCWDEDTGGGHLYYSGPSRDWSICVKCPYN